MTRFLTVVIIVLLLPASAAAQDDSAEIAKDHYDRGAALYFQGDYGQAILEFMRAYDALPEPVFMYNIAMSHWRLGNIDRAIEAGERTLRADMEAGLRAQVQARTTVFYRLRHIDEANWTPAPPLEATPIEEPLITAAPPTEPSHVLRWTGIGIAGLGVGLLGAFTAAELRLQAKVRDYEAAAHAGSAAQYEDLKSKIDRSQPIALALLWSGVGLLAAGGTLVAIDLANTSENSAHLTVGPNGITMGIAW